MPPLHLLLAFLLASLILAVTPGPGVVYILARSLTQGRRAGLASVGGVAIGNLVNALGASLGLAALFLAASWTFLVVKYAGAAYLMYLGIMALRAPPLASGASTARAGGTAGGPQVPRIFRDGFLVAVLNPKTAVFFAAFLPQFMTPGGTEAGQAVLLGAVFVLVAAATDTAYALAAGALAPVLAGCGRTRALGRYVSGGTLIGLGVYTSLSGTPRGR